MYTLLPLIKFITINSLLIVSIKGIRFVSKNASLKLLFAINPLCLAISAFTLYLVSYQVSHVHLPYAKISGN